MDQNQLQEDIHFIKQMIENNRRTLVDNGITYISIGIYVVIGVPISLLLGMNGYENWIPYLWLFLMTALIAFNLFFTKKFEKKKQKKTFGSEMLGVTWGACAAPIIILTLLYFFTGEVSTPSFFASISAILGIGYYLTGFINDLKFMRVLAFCWWAGSIISVMWNYIGEEYLLSIFFAVMIFVFEVIPGIIIYKKWKRVYNA